jgi:hypothetical protein
MNMNITSPVKEWRSARGLWHYSVRERKGIKTEWWWYVAVLMEVKNFIHWKVWKTTLLERFGALSI